MSTYEYQCQSCKKRFTLTLSIAQHETERVKCPKCKSTRVRQAITPFFAQTSKKS